MEKHILRYGTNADQKYFGNGLESCYDMIAINANMIAFAPNALAIFVGRQTIDKPFFIDPITHIFQHSQGYISGTGGDIKRSIGGLVDKYTEGIYAESDDTQMRFDSVKAKMKGDLDEDFLTPFVSNVVNYQKSFIKAKEDIEKYNKYVDFAKTEDSSLSNLRMAQEPKFLVAPYLLIEDESLIEKNIAFLKKAKEVETEKPIFAQLVLSKRFYDKEILKDGDERFGALLDAYKSSQADGFLLWIDGFSEHDEVAESLNHYIHILKSLKSVNKPVYCLYGSYLSIMLTAAELSLLEGVSHGLEYGESREVVPVGGGIPTAKFYFYPVHKRIKMKDMIEVIRSLEIKDKEDYYARICDCAVCKEAIKSGNKDGVLTDFQNAFAEAKAFTAQRGETLVSLSYPTPEAKKRSVMHYLHSKKREFSDAQSRSKIELLQQMRDALEAYGGVLDPEETAHLNEWVAAISTI